MGKLWHLGYETEDEVVSGDNVVNHNVHDYVLLFLEFVSKDEIVLQKVPSASELCIYNIYVQTQYKRVLSQRCT